MSETAVAAGSAPAPKSLLARFIGILTSPRSTFQDVATTPRWLGMLAITTILIAFFTALPLTTEEGRQAAIDQQISAMKSFGFTVTPEVESRLEQAATRMPYTTGGSVLVVSPIIVAIVAGIFFAIFNAALGGEASFKQVYAIIVHAGVVSTLSAVFSGAINYLRGSTGSATNLAALLPMVSEQSFAGHLLGAIDVFLVWWLVVLATGLAVLYKRRTQPIAISLFGLYAVIAIVIALVKSRSGGA
jgi:Yip1-like protein